MKIRSVLTLLAVIGALPINNANATGTCYQWSAFPNSRIEYLTGNLGKITTDSEEDKFDHADQTVYRVNGKLVNPCEPAGTMATTTGTIVVGNPGFNADNEPTGAHLGLEVHISRGDGNFGGVDSCRSVEIECMTPTRSTTPRTWFCESRNEFDIYHSKSTLTKVSSSEDELCSVFQNGESLTPLTAPLTAPAPGSSPGSK